MQIHNSQLSGAGLGLRRSLMEPMRETPPSQLDFLEVAPENWLGIGGAEGRRFARFTERYPMVCHGLSLSLGGPAPLDEGFVKQLKGFFDRHQVALYSEHLSYCNDGGHLYDLLPIPFTGEAVHYVAERIRRVQQILERRIAIENVSYYAPMPGEMSEQAFILAVLEEADCDLLLDVNNAFVNGHNHGYDPAAFIDAMPAERIAYLHIAGHLQQSEELIVDTHGAEIIDPVWQLLDHTYRVHGVLPTLLERDFNLPPLDELLQEVDRIVETQHYWSEQDVPRHQAV